MANADYMLDTSGCKNTLRKYNTYCFALQKWLHKSASLSCGHCLIRYFIVRATNLLTDLAAAFPWYVLYISLNVG